jgi:putative ABC transport system permease protein
MVADVLYALRQLRRSLGFTLATVLTLALGLGATTAIFSVADAVLLRPLPYPTSDRLVMVRDELSKMGVHYTDVSYETFNAYQKSRSFDATTAFIEEDRNLIGSGAAERVAVLSSTPSLLGMLGAHTALGRAFGNQDWNPEHNDVAILSYSLFASRFGANPATVGRTVRLDGRLYTVVGVMAPSFEFGLDGKGADVWVPLPTMKDPRVWQFHMLARMRPGIDIAAAQASITDVAKHVEEIVRPYRGPNGEDGGYRARVFSLRNRLLGDFQTGSLLLLAASALLLLIACVNVANLLLARAAAREKETAIRRALGASGLRLVRQWMTEAAVLATIGGAAGLVISHWGILLLKLLSPAELPANSSIGIDSRMLLFTCGTSGMVCLVLSLAPALATPGGNVTLRGPRRRRHMANWLVTAEVAIAVVLLIGCGLLAKSLARLRQIDPGVRIEHLLTMQIQLSGPRYEKARQRVRFFSELQDRLAKMPGVISASEVSILPVFTVGVDTRYGNPFSTDAHRWNPNAQTRQMAHTITVGRGYFRTMGIALRRGRDFSRSDVLDAPPVAIVNETLARGFFPNGDAVGRRILFGAPTPGGTDRWMTIIGVISDVRTGALDLPPAPQFYTSEMQENNDRMFIVLRTQGNPIAMGRTALRIVHQLDPEQPVSDVRTMEQHVDGTLGQPRFRAMLISCFASMALFLAAVGIYGVVAHAVSQRTKEIGIRSALGADATRIVVTVLADGLRPIAVGVAIGIGGSAMLTRFLSSILYQVKPDDPITFAWSIVLIGTIGVAACLVPAATASRLDPVIALRED